jgi:hypothetical protein
VAGAEVTQFTTTIKVPDVVYREPTTFINTAFLLLRLLGGLAILSLVVAGFVIALRKHRLPWQRALRWTLALAIIPIINTAAHWELSLFEYNTSITWQTFVTNQTINVIRNVGRWGTDAPPKSSFPVDTSYVAQPPAYTALRAVTVPAQGGATQFTDQYHAADTLPDDLRGRVEGRTITHVVTGVDPVEGESSAEHPVLRPHPLSGRTALFLTTPARCAAVSGLDPEESQEVVRLLFEHSTAPDNVTMSAVMLRSRSQLSSVNG